MSRRGKLNAQRRTACRSTSTKVLVRLDAEGFEQVGELAVDTDTEVGRIVVGEAGQHGARQMAVRRRQALEIFKRIGAAEVMDAQVELDSLPASAAPDAPGSADGSTEGHVADVRIPR
jgi:hypothetical protein